MTGGTRRQLLVALGAALVGGGLAGCAAESGGSAPVAAASVSPRTTSVSPARASVRGGTEVTVHGTGLGDVTSVSVQGRRVEVTSASARRVVFTAPGSTDFAAGTASARLLAGTEEVTAATITYAALDGIDRQLQYVLTYWQDYNPEYEAISGDDCVDFTSQSLLQRGWEQQGEWTHAASVYDSGVAWRGSTAFMAFMTANPALGTALTDDQRERVRLGDVVQFDWDGSGDRDHTGVVTRVATVDGKRKVYFAGHTNDSDYRDVDEAITTDHPGGTAYYWSLA